MKIIEKAKARKFSIAVYTDYNYPCKLILNISIPYILNWYIDTGHLISNPNNVEYNWGFTTFSANVPYDSLHIYWKTWYKIFDMPWSLQIHKTWYKDIYGYIVDKTLDTESPDFKKNFCKILPFTYVTKYNDTQKAYAKCWIEGREWRRKWLPFSKIGNFIKYSLEVEFYSDKKCSKIKDIGENVGTWKGGVTFISFNMTDKDETHEDALKRLEQEGKEFKQFQ